MNANKEKPKKYKSLILDQNSEYNSNLINYQCKLPSCDIFTKNTYEYSRINIKKSNFYDNIYENSLDKFSDHTLYNSNIFYESNLNHDQNLK